ncbi:hypothetical protein TIFTF001_010951 [Ficus carica]|uniref:Uncharacterized protein n=1 Tax=Ficus carica TaxID=3494 RepID=A0AA87ZXD9_FICCA|nr:hypothetical protein TIFTF001_010951 [Ficus carica]
MENFGPKMELLRLSKFKLQLQSLITDVRELRERERSATEQLHCRIQKQKQTEEEYARKLQELQIELSSSNELRQKFERKVNYLQNDNALLEAKQTELKETIQSLIQSKELFVNTYDESTSDMKRSIHVRDRKLMADLRSKLDKVSSFEKAFVEKISDLEHKLKCSEDHIQRKNKVISELEAQLEAATISTACQAQIDEISIPLPMICGS